MNLSVDIAGVTMKNPVTTGSGTFGSGEEFSEFVDLSKLGAIWWYVKCDRIAESWDQCVC